MQEGFQPCTFIPLQMIGQRIAYLYENVNLDPYGEIQWKGRRGQGVTDVVSDPYTTTTSVSVIRMTSVTG